jgi:hypothetical protein
VGEAHVTMASTAHVVVVVGGAPVPGVQQYAVPLPPAVPVLHVSDALSWSGVSLPEHEKPIDGSSHPVTVASCAHVPDDAV